MAEEFGFIADQPVSVDEFGFVPDTPTVPRGTAPFTGFTPEQQAIADQFIAQAQRPASSKFFEGALGLGKALYNPLEALAKGIGAIPEIADQPSRLLPTFGEAGRRVGMDVVSLADMLNQLTGAPSALDPNAAPVEPSILGAIKAGIPGLGLAENIRQGIAGLAPRTPTQAEVQQFVEGAPLREALAAERTTIDPLYEGAQPEFAEAIAQTIELAPPIKSVQALKGGINIAKAPISTLVRSAIKPSNPKIGAAVEKAAASEMNEIFERNPNAHTMANTPIEGFATEVKGALTETGERLSQLRAQSGTTLNAGDQLGEKILQKAIDLEKAGQPRKMIDEFVNIAEAKVGRMTDLNSLQDGVTMANRKYTGIPKTTAEGIADEIIAQEGGKLINLELKAIGGAEGEAIRKKWSNLKTLNDNVEVTVNKLINNAPAEAQPALLTALNSPQGLAGVFALANGWGTGAVAIGSKFISDWAKKASRDLKDPNAIITGVYNRMAADPLRTTRVGPVATVPTVSPSAAIPPPLPVTPPPLPPLNPLQQSVTDIVFPTRPTQGRPKVVPSTIGDLYKDFTPEQLLREADRLVQVDPFKAQQIIDFMRSQGL